jgi:hypothetical protein
LPGGGGLTAPYTRSNRPLWLAGFRGVSAVVGACVLRLLVEFVPRTSSTPVDTWFWQTEGRSVERVILGVRPSEFVLSEFNLLRQEFLSAPIHSPPLWSPNRSFKHGWMSCASLRLILCLQTPGNHFDSRIFVRSSSFWWFSKDPRFPVI